MSVHMGRPPRERPGPLLSSWPSSLGSCRRQNGRGSEGLMEGISSGCLGLATSMGFFSDLLQLCGQPRLTAKRQEVHDSEETQ